MMTAARLTSLRRPGVENYDHFYRVSPKTAAEHTPTPTPIQNTISRDLVVAYEATERVMENLSVLLKDEASIDFLASHRLIHEKITSNRNLLVMLMENIDNIHLMIEEHDFKLQYPDYFTK